MNNRNIIIVAGGTGSRMNPDIPKQFLPLDGLPVLMHTINAFLKFDPSARIIIALPREFYSFWNTLCLKYNFQVRHEFTEGGETRTQSVKNALALIPASGYTAIHDAVRPLVSEGTIRRAFKDAKIFGNAVPVIPVNESVRRTKGKSSTAIPRDTLYIVQTPQVFRTGLIKKAYSSVGRDDYTDDATVLETTGENIHLSEGNRENIKITYPNDLLIAEVLLRSASGK